MHPKLSVILITWNSEHFVPSCLESVCQALQGISYELILVDNGSTDRTRELLAPYAALAQARFLPQPENLGVARARNIGLRQATGDYVWLLDIDTVVCREAVQAMLDYLDTHPDCGICGCQLHRADGEIQDSCRRFPSFRYKMLNVLQVLATRIPGNRRLQDCLSSWNASQFYHREMAGTDPFEVEYLIGACQMIRREVIGQVGLLDEHIFYGPEDADFCLRTWQEGWKVVYLPFVRFRHDYQKITNRRLCSRMSWVHTRALFYFFFKHRRF